MTKQMNRVSPKVLLNSKWTAVNIVNKEKHFIIVEVVFDEDHQVTDCIIEAVMTENAYSIDWRDLKQKSKWLIGWK